MENRKTGPVIIIISVLIVFFVYSFSTFPQTRPGTDVLTISGYIFALLVLVFGIYLTISGKEATPRTSPQAERKEMTIENFGETLDRMEIGERRVFEKLIEEKGSALQSNLIRHTGFSKVKITRILDRLEQRDLIERKRRGMTNIVIIKE
jgi:uncharacterized membrane protein